MGSFKYLTEYYKNREYVYTDIISYIEKDVFNVNYLYGNLNFKYITMFIFMNSVYEANINNDRKKEIYDHLVISNPVGIYYVDKTEKRCIAAVKRHNDAIRLIPSIYRSYEVCKEAIKKHVKNLMYAPNQTNELCKLAIDTNVIALQYVKQQTEELCSYAINKKWYAIRFVKTQSLRLCIEAVKKDELAFRYIYPPYKTTIQNMVDKGELVL